MRAAFTSEVSAIEATMGAQLSAAHDGLSRLEAMICHPTQADAEALIASGRELRRRFRETDLRLVTLSATQAPVACDLRLVLTLLQIAQHQGLIANQFGLIGEQLTEIDSGVTDRCGTTERLCELARLACQQLHGAAQAFAQRDAGSSEALRRSDAQLNRLNREICRASLETPAGPEHRELAFRHVLIARSLERIGDNSVGIARNMAELVQADVHHLAHPGAASPLGALS
ncbi:MAG TPA: PhoU domain-containing protein [Solirubrobacteraceae bacterium]|nr:PhoU domain-containing protein [Solirubrobacteraceae bacterium]